MELAILAQDLSSLSLALRDGQTILQKKIVSASPEEHLRRIDETLREWGTALSQLTGVFVVTGPGSFTASRVSTTIANTLAFALSTPVTAIENPNHLTLEELLRSRKMVCLAEAFVLPAYNRPANITSAKGVQAGGTASVSDRRRSLRAPAEPAP